MQTQASGRAVGWDLDHTLVGYPSAARMETTEDMVPRPGIEHTLQRLSARGYQHYITTGASRAYAERVLAATGLRQHISGIFEGATIDARSAKRYRPLAQALGFSDEIARQRLIVTGDLLYDQPADIDGLVFIHQPNGYRHHATQIEALIELFEDAGGGDLNAGFHVVLRAFDHAQAGTHEAASRFAARLPRGASISFELRDPHREHPIPGVAPIIIPRVLLLAPQ